MLLIRLVLKLLNFQNRLDVSMQILQFFFSYIDVNDMNAMKRHM